MKKILLQLLLWSAVALSATSCVKPFVSRVVRSTNLQYRVPKPELYADNTFDGIDQFIAQSSPRANILLTHGLTDKSPNHFDLLVERLATRLKLQLVQPRKTIKTGDITDHPNQRELGFDAWRLFQWKFIDSLKKPVNFYFVYWAPITKPAKDFIHKYTRTEYRTQLASQTKDSLFINIFGDLALYLNTHYKLQLGSAFLESFDQIGEGPVAVIGGGFGIQLMFDALSFEVSTQVEKRDGILQKENRGINIPDAMLQKARYKRSSQDSTYKSDYNIWKVYLLNNQFPFVSMLNLLPDDSPRTADHNKHILDAMRVFCKFTKRETLDVVSFYDPNDAFGYWLPKTDTVNVTNVRLNVAESWWIDPQKTTDFLLPQLKKQKAADLFLNVINQKDTVQEIMLNLKGPADLTRNDYRVIGALAEGSVYKLVVPLPSPQLLIPRQPEMKPKIDHASWKSLKNLVALVLLKGKLEAKSSVLPFSIPSKFRDSQPDTIVAREFEGIEKSIMSNDVTQVMTVHGVKDQEPDSFEDLTSSIAKSLGFYSRPTDFKVICADGSNCPRSGPLKHSFRPGTVKITTYTGVWGQKLIVYAVYWSSVTKHPKEWLDEISIYDESSVVPKIVKRDLINDGFADIELSFGHLKTQITATIETALNTMNADYNSSTKTAKRNTYFITGSLGSKLLLDYWNKGESAATNVSPRLRSWFMLTNQLIMTALKEINNGRPDARNISYEQFYEDALGHPLANNLNDTTSFDLVGFNDPNDLLSFILPDDVMGISPDAKKVYNNYLNLAQGVTINMDNMVKVARKVDDRLTWYVHRTYRKQIKNFTRNGFSASGVPVGKSDPAFRDYMDMLSFAGERFQLDGYAPDTARSINPDIETLLMQPATSQRNAKLFDLFNKKQKYYTYNVFVTEAQKSALRSRFNQTITTQKTATVTASLQKRRALYGISAGLTTRQVKTAEKVGRAKVISEQHFKQMFEPGPLMPFVRSLSTYMHYQDFVTDFGRAHVGAKESSRVVQMISHGFHTLGWNAVTFTNVSQNLYNDLHNRHQ